MELHNYYRKTQKNYLVEFHDIDIFFDCVYNVYPPIEKTPPRFAISKRNEWMMANADLIIAYVNHTYGGAYKSLGIAVQRKKKIINICDFL